MTADVLLQAIIAHKAMKYGVGPVPSPSDAALYRAAGLAFPQMKPGWPVDTGEGA